MTETVMETGALNSLRYLLVPLSDMDKCYKKALAFWGKCLNIYNPFSVKTVESSFKNQEVHFCHRLVFLEHSILFFYPHIAN